MRACVRACVCACVCKREKAREREWGRERERERERETGRIVDKLFVCIHYMTWRHHYNNFLVPPSLSLRLCFEYTAKTCDSTTCAVLVVCE